MKLLVALLFCFCIPLGVLSYIFQPKHRFFYQNLQIDHPPSPKSFSPTGLISDTVGSTVAWGGMRLSQGPLAFARTAQDMQDLYGSALDTIQPVTNKAKEEFATKVTNALTANNEDARLNVTDLLQKYKYPVEVHTVKTEDGYVLTVMRMQQPKKLPHKPAPVVFLMHGLLDSADDWVIMGPGKSLAYILYDAGYEVWLGNTRGNKYCRKHVNKHPVQGEFWQFSWDEIGRFDLPAMIDYALEVSQQSSLFYVGHSQGTTSFFVMASLRPEYNKKIKLMFALAPVAWMTNVVSPLVRLSSPGSTMAGKFLTAIGVNEFLPSNAVLQSAGGFMCQSKALSSTVCSNAMFVMYGFNLEQLNATMIPVMVGHVPAGSSVKQVVHYGQGLVSKDFRRFDFGMEVNEKVYGSRKAPSYPLEEITAPIALYYSDNDWLAHPKDVKTLRERLPKVVDFYLVPDKRFNHMDYLWAMNAPEIIYNRVLKTLLQFH